MELRHFGILGMKWGVRRYQNKDGSLTPEGRSRYGLGKYDTLDEYYSKHRKISVTRNGRAENVKWDPKSKAYIIKKGTLSYRMATPNEPIDDKRKYVSFTQADREKYKDFAANGQLWAQGHMEEYKYKAVKDLRIADSETVYKLIGGLNRVPVVSNFGKTAAEAAQLLANKDRIGTDSHYSKLIKGVAGPFRRGLSFTQFLMQSPKRVSEAIENLKALGYDGMVDIEDFATGGELPAILFTPRESLKGA